MTSAENVFFFPLWLFGELKTNSNSISRNGSTLWLLMLYHVPFHSCDLRQVTLHFFMRIKIVPIHSVVTELNNMKCINSAWHKGNINVSDYYYNASVQFSSVAQSCPTLCNPMNRSTPGLPVHHQLLEFTQTHVHRVSDAIQPSCPLSSPSTPVSNPSQHQGLFQWVNSSHQVAKVLEFQL